MDNPSLTNGLMSVKIGGDTAAIFVHCQNALVSLRLLTVAGIKGRDFAVVYTAHTLLLHESQQFLRFGEQRVCCILAPGGLAFLCFSKLEALISPPRQPSWLRLHISSRVRGKTGFQACCLR